MLVVQTQGFSLAYSKFNQQKRHFTLDVSTLSGAKETLPSVRIRTSLVYSSHKQAAAAQAATELTQEGSVQGRKRTNKASVSGTVRLSSA